MSEDDRAPDFSGTYPSGGERIGPAWQRTWERLADGEWRAGRALADEIGPEAGVNPKTILGLLHKAAERNLVGHRLSTERVDGRRPARRAWYRRTDGNVRNA